MPTIASPAAPTTTASTRKLPNAASTPATAASIDAPPRSRRRSSIFGCRAWLAAGWENSNKDVSRQIECVNDPVQEVGWHPPGCPVSTAGKRPSAPSRPPYGSRGGPRQGRLALDPLLVFQAETGEWALFQARGLDRPAAGLADPVGALLQPLESRLDLPELGLHLLQDGDVLLVLEDLRPDVGGVLVVVGQLADAGEIRRRLGVAPQVALHAQQALALRFEPRADLALVPTRPSTNSGRDRGPPYSLTRSSGTLDLRCALQHPAPGAALTTGAGPSPGAARRSSAAPRTTSANCAARSLPSAGRSPACCPATGPPGSASWSRRGA